LSIDKLPLGNAGRSSCPAFSGAFFVKASAHQPKGAAGTASLTGSGITLLQYDFGASLREIY
jgi:hypothetical protein